MSGGFLGRWRLGRLLITLGFGSEGSQGPQIDTSVGCVQVDPAPVTNFVCVPFMVTDFVSKPFKVTEFTVTPEAC